ncbi:MAG TPA: cyclase family protein [Bryobacteraceae bacterium]|nr:cyclase family protein [Bryobacteraceae bacterium]
MTLPATPPYDLGQTYYVGMPHFPTHPPYLYGLTKLHGESVYEGGGSSAADGLALGSHVGTHIDALCHFSCNGFVYGGRSVERAQSYGGGLTELSADTIEPIVRRGVLLDFGELSEGDEIRPADLESASRGLEIHTGDVVLLRTGWARRFSDAARFVNGVRSPGPGIDGARWLSERGVFAAGSDTLAFERVPSTTMAVHVHLLVDRGIHIIEVLDLEAIARDGIREFVFVAAPLKLRGATGAPVRPLAFPLSA